MMKQFYFKGLFSLLLLLVGGVSVAWGETTYHLSQVSSVEAGNMYVFVRNSRALGNTVSSKALQTVSTYSTTNLTGSEAYVWLLETATNGYYLKNVSLSTNQYLNNASDKTDISLGSKSSIWTIAITNNVALISNKSNSNRFLGETSSGSNAYKAYATSNLSSYGHDFTVYKLIEDEADDTDYTITIDSEHISHGTVTASASTAKSGTEITLTPTPDSGYKFSTWDVKDTGNNSVTVTNNKFTMPSSNVTVRASFEESVTYEINYSVNGSIVKTVNVEKDETVDLSAPISGIPSGYVFTGWVVEANKIETPTDTDPGANYVTSATSIANITYYAVMAIVEDGDAATATLTANSSWSSYTNQTFTDDENNTWNANCSGQNNSGTFYYGLNGGTSYVESPIFSGRVTNIVIKATNGSGKENRFFYIKSTKNGTADLGSLLVLPSTGNQELTVTLEDGVSFDKFFLTSSAALQFTKIKVTYTPIIHKSFCTTVPPHVIASYADGWTSYVTTDDVEFPEALEAYVITSTNAGILREKITQAPAGTPLVIHATEGAKTYNLQPLNSAPAAPAVNELKASDGSITIDDSNYKKIYVLTVVDDEAGFGPLAKGRTLAAGKVYLEFNTAQAKDFIGFFDTTGIEDVNLQPSPLDPRPSTMCNLSGQRVSESYKGIVIINGKKVIRK